MYSSSFKFFAPDIYNLFSHFVLYKNKKKNKTANCFSLILNQFKIP